MLRTLLLRFYNFTFNTEHSVFKFSFIETSYLTFIYTSADTTSFREEDFIYKEFFFRVGFFDLLSGKTPKYFFESGNRGLITPLYIFEKRTQFSSVYSYDFTI